MEDLNKIFALLHIAEKTLQWPRLAALHQRALAELESLAKDSNPLSKIADAPIAETNLPADEPKAIPADTTYTSDLGAPFNQPTLPNLERKI